MNSILAELEPVLSQSFEEISKEYQGVAVACSGGLDSTALLYVFYNLIKNKKNFSLAICHVNFGLRGEESDADQEFLKTLADTLKLPFFVKQISSEQAPKSNIQDWARQVRYEFFQNLAEKGWAIGIAHTEDDCVENILLRLFRGSPLNQLLGMSAWRKPFWRPFLQVTRQTLQRYCLEKGFDYREDSSNRSDKYSRNFLRLNILPELRKRFPGVDQKILRLANIDRDRKISCSGKNKSLKAASISLQKPRVGQHAYTSLVNEHRFFLAARSTCEVYSLGERGLDNRNKSLRLQNKGQNPLGIAIISLPAKGKLFFAEKLWDLKSLKDKNSDLFASEHGFFCLQKVEFWILGQNKWQTIGLLKDKNLYKPNHLGRLEKFESDHSIFHDKSTMI